MIDLNVDAQNATSDSRRMNHKRNSRVNQRTCTVLLLKAMLLGAVAGCAPIEPPSPGSDHPASREAPAAADVALSDVLAVDEKNVPRTPPEMLRGMMHHGHGDGQMGGRSSGQDATEPQHGSPPTPQARRLYACPMHPEVTAEKPGTCPVCGMELVPNGGPGDE
jgi:uncharacterized protein involved in copper resistance